MIQENVDITSRHTFGIATQAQAWADYNSVDELRQIILEAKERNLPIMPIGEGSNLLFVKKYEGLLLHSAITTLNTTPVDNNEILVHAGSGWIWDDFVAHCVAQGWYGIENLSYIPGTVGASAVQNVGAYGVEACDVIESVSLLATDTLKECTIKASECNYGYRTSLFKSEWRGMYIVTGVTFRLSLTPRYTLDYGNLRQVVGDTPTLQGVRDAVIEIRRKKLPEPSVLGSAGSFFVNPVIGREHYQKLLEKYPEMPHYEVNDEQVKVPAAWLIDHLGWKGKSLGGAMVYEQQPLVIVNTGNAKPGHVVQLAQDIAFSVFENFGIIITPEVNYVY
ncbi:MAG: UDP-N-acetylmuramate dehydrogenase [Bacteroidaceae bacterium]|nr:UDP-N-acetylmuramate dehydrogenase [Bacteroidaceae bacterium]